MKTLVSPFFWKILSFGHPVSIQTIFLQEAVTGIKLVKAFVLEKAMHKEHEGCIDKYDMADYKSKK